MGQRRPQQQRQGPQVSVQYSTVQYSTVQVRSAAAPSQLLVNLPRSIPNSHQLGLLLLLLGIVDVLKYPFLAPLSLIR